jgi:integrase
MGIYIHPRAPADGPARRRRRTRLPRPVILKTYLYTGVRLATAGRLRVRDFHQDGDEATLIINEKGNRHHTIDIHFAAAKALPNTSARPGWRADRCSEPSGHLVPINSASNP